MVLDGARRPWSLRGSVTLFKGEDWVELRTTCSVAERSPREQLADAAWIELINRCTKELLLPFEDQK